MFPLTIDLQEGFTGESVVVHLDGTELARLARVETRPQIGFAERVTATIKPGKHALRVDLVGKHSATLELQASAPCFVGVEVRNDKLELRVQDREFWYA